MSNTSATGGYLTPAGQTPVMGTALVGLFQQMIVGITSLPGNLVYQSWQAEPPVIPPAATAFASVGILSRIADVFAANPHQTNSSGGNSSVLRNETLEVSADFYDLGISGQADALASVLRDGLAMPQNLEAINGAGIYLLSANELVPLPTLFDQRWRYRVNLKMKFARQLLWTYPVLDVVGADIVVQSANDVKVVVTDDINLPH